MDQTKTDRHPVRTLLREVDDIAQRHGLTLPETGLLRWKVALLVWRKLRELADDGECSVVAWRDTGPIARRHASPDRLSGELLDAVTGFMADVTGGRFATSTNRKAHMFRIGQHDDDGEGLPVPPPPAIPEGRLQAVPAVTGAAGASAPATTPAPAPAPAPAPEPSPRRQPMPLGSLSDFPTVITVGDMIGCALVRDMLNGAIEPPRDRGLWPAAPSEGDDHAGFLAFLGSDLGARILDEVAHAEDVYLLV